MSFFRTPEETALAQAQQAAYWAEVDAFFAKATCLYCGRGSEQVSGMSRQHDDTAICDDCYNN